MRDFLELQSMHKFACDVLSVPHTPIDPKLLPLLPSISSKQVLYSPASPAHVRFSSISHSKPSQKTQIFKHNTAKLLHSTLKLKELQSKYTQNFSESPLQPRLSKQSSNASQTRSNTYRSGRSSTIAKETSDIDEGLSSVPPYLRKFVQKLIQENDKSPKKESLIDKKYSRLRIPARENSNKFKGLKQHISPKNQPSLFQMLKIKTNKCLNTGYNIKRLNSCTLLTASKSPKTTIKICLKYNSPTETLTDDESGDEYLYNKELELSSLYDQSKKIQSILNFKPNPKIDRVFNRISHRISLETEKYLSG